MAAPDASVSTAPRTSAQPRRSQPAAWQQQLQRWWTIIRDYAQAPHAPQWKLRLGWADWVLAAALLIVVSLARIAMIAWQNDPRGVAYFFHDWDGKNYLAIAQYGYFTADGTGAPDPKIYERRLAFFPGLPMLMRGMHELFGIPYVTAGLIITNICAYLAVLGMMALLARLGQRLSIRCLGAVLLLGAPMAITLNMVYTEPVFLALMIWAIVALYDSHLWAAALLIFLAGFIRLTAVDLVLAFAIIVFFRYRQSWQVWLGVLISSTSIVSYITWVGRVSGDSGSYFDMQRKGWNSSFDFGASSVGWTVSTLVHNYAWIPLVAAGCIITAVFAVCYAWRRLPFEYWIMATGVVANVVLSGGFFYSRPRLLFPAVILLLPLAIKAKQWPRWAVGLAAFVWLAHSVAFGAYMLVHSPAAI